MTAWSTTLSVWDGILEATESNDLTWSGTYHSFENAPVAAKVAEPKRGAFSRDCDSNKAFSVTGKARNEPGGTFLASLTGGEGFDAAPGMKIRDAQHNMQLLKLHWSGGAQKDCLVFGVGSNELGSFLETGWMRPGNRVTVARRYLNGGDPRVAWSVQTLRDSVMKQIYDTEEDAVCMPPWQCNVLDAKLTT